MNYSNSNMLLELDELVEEYGQDILAAKSDVLDVGRIDGQLYAITGTRQHYNSQGLMVVTEYAEKYGLDTSQPVGYQPDLVLINGVLNWGPGLGTTAQYKELLRQLVRKLQKETQADLVLMTPNGDLPNPMMEPPPEEERTEDRVRAVREVAWEEGVCLADAYAVWEKARDAGCPWKELLANGINHPGVEGHTAYALTLMKLCGE